MNTVKRIPIQIENAIEIMEKLRSRGLKVEMKNSKNFHMVVTGNARPVNFYPTTGTINCNPFNNFKAFSLKGAKHETAMLRVADLAEHGY